MYKNRKSLWKRISGNLYEPVLSTASLSNINAMIILMGSECKSETEKIHNKPG